MDVDLMKVYGSASKRDRIKIPKIPKYFYLGISRKIYSTFKRRFLYVLQSNGI